MCPPQIKLKGSPSSSVDMGVSHIHGRPVLQPNRVLDRRNSLKNPNPNPNPTKINTTIPKTKTSPPPLSPKLKYDNDHLNLSSEKISQPRISISKTISTEKKLRKCVSFTHGVTNNNNMNNLSSGTVEAPGSIAAARREEVAMMQVRRKMKIAHYGRTKSAKFEGNKVVPWDVSGHVNVVKDDYKRCSFITSNSDPVYIKYHDEEWGVPNHDDNLLFELLVLTAAQVGSDWTSVLKKRQVFRDAFADFDAETISKYSEKKIVSISVDYGIELSLVRGIVDNSNRIIEIKKGFGSFDKYLWGFVNNKPIATKYKLSQKIPVKTSKSESISKDMVRRGFRLVGPTVIHSFMQAAGLTNDHLVTCLRHRQCTI